MILQSFRILCAAAVVFACLTTFGCKTAHTTASAESQISQSRSATFHVAERDVRTRVLSVDSIVYDWAQESPNKFENTHAHNVSPTSTATPLSVYADSCVTFEEGDSSSLSSVINHRLKRTASCAAAPRIKIYGLRISASSELQSVVSASSRDSAISLSREAQSPSTKAAPSATPYLVALIAVYIVSAFIYYWRKRK